MRRIKLIVAYDGTNYCGWQVQPNGITVQEVLNQALSDLFAKKTACIGASRTDAGVHALGNVAVFDTDARMPADGRLFHPVVAVIPTGGSTCTVAWYCPYHPFVLFVPALGTVRTTA